MSIAPSSSAAPLVTYKGTVYPWHCDHVGHMNVMWYVGKFDEATWGFFHAIGITPSYLRDRSRGMAAVQQTISYRKELLAGDFVEVTSRLLEVREKALRFEHTMRRAEDGEIAAVTELTGVHLDRVARKACPFPPELKAALAALLRTSGADAACLPGPGRQDASGMSAPRHL